MRDLEAQVVIVGAGFAGCVLAALLRRAGISCIVLEQQKRVPERYRGEIMQPYAVEVFRQTGYLDRILAAGAAKVSEFEDLCVLDGRAMAVRRKVQPSANLPAEAVILRYKLMMEAFRATVRELLGDHLFEGAKVGAIERGPDGRWVLNGVDEDGLPLRARGFLLVAADGVQSLVRRSLPFEVEEAPPQYAFAGIVIRAPAAGFPYFTSMYPLGRGFFGNAFPVRTDEVRFCMAVNIDTSRAAHDELGELVLGFARDTLGPLGYQIPDAPELAEELKIEPVIRVRTQKAVLDGVCLVGDAAGTVHPITGYGATLACNDVLNLGRLLAAAPPRAVVPASVLSAFEQRRHAIRRGLEELSDLYVRIYLGTGEPDLRAAYWRYFCGEDATPGHAVIERFEKVSDELGREFDRVEF